jgi:ABC-type branched-subunit amino acid transport system substrate-binding protein
MMKRARLYQQPLAAYDSYVVRFAQLCSPILPLAFALLLAACAGKAGDPGSTATVAPASQTPSPSPTPSGPTPIPGPGVTATAITLGMTNDMLGTGDTPYAAVTQAMQAYLRKTNAEDDGACGRQIILATEDDGYSPTVALEKTKLLVEQKGVLGMVGGISTDQQLQVAPYLNDPNGDTIKDDGVPDLFVASGAGAWGDITRFPWTIDYAPDYVSDGAVLARWASANLAGKKLAVVYPDTDFGKDYLAGFVAGLTDRTQLVASNAYPGDAANANDQIATVKNAAADAVLIAAGPEITAASITFAASIQYAPQWLISYTIAPSTLASRLGGGPSPEQLLAGFAMLRGAVTNTYLLSPVADQETAPIVEHKRIMQAYQGPTPSSLSVYGQSLGEVTVATLRASCNDLTRPGLMRAAESLNGFHSSLMLDGIDVNLSHEDHRAIQSLQPVQVDVDGSVIAHGAVISAEDINAPAPPAGSPSATPTPGEN